MANGTISIQTRKSCIATEMCSADVDMVSLLRKKKKKDSDTTYLQG